MSIREVRPGVWQVRVYVGVIGGRERYAYQTLYGTKKDALAAERQTITRNGGIGRRSAAFDLTVDEYFDLWLSDYIAPYRKRSTTENYAFTLKRLRPHIGSIPLRKLTPQDIQRAYARIGKTLAPTTVRDTHRVLHAALERAFKDDILSLNISERVELPVFKPMQPKTLTPAEAVRLLETAKGTPHYELLAVALLTGMRMGELRRLEWRDVDLAGGALAVREAKTAAGQRIVLLPASAVALLAEMHSKRQPSPVDYVFVGKTGNQVLPSLSAEYLRLLLKKAGLPYMRFHDLRHTHATWLAAMDLNPRTLADRLGHADAGFTLRTYAHASRTAQAKAAAIAGDILALPKNAENETGR